jgi:hypothetical protein
MEEQERLKEATKKQRRDEETMEGFYNKMKEMTMRMTTLQVQRLQSSESQQSKLPSIIRE